MQTTVLSTGFAGTPADYAWVIPVPQLPSRGEVTLWDDGERAFGDLFNLTEPRAVFGAGGPDVGTSGCGCRSGAGGAAGGAEMVFAPVTVVDRLNVRGVEISLLSAQDSLNLNQWLNDNGYRFPDEGTEALQYYVNKTWFFIAARVDVPEGGNQNVEARPIPPLRISFRTSQIVFPMRISSVSSEPQGSEVLLYVFADQRLRAQNYPTVEISLPERVYESSSDFQNTYRQTFSSLLDQPEGRALVVEYARRHSDLELSGTALRGLLPPNRQWFLTRLRSVLRPVDMRDDIVFVPDPNDSTVSIVAAYNAAGRDRARFVVWATVLMSMGLHVAMQRTKRSLRQAVVAMAIGIVLFL